jgi:hypothetical protein
MPRLLTVASVLALSAGPSLAQTFLLFDDHSVARTTNLTQHYLPAQKHPSNPVIKRTELWEGVGPYVWGNRLMQDEKTGELRLWYIAYDYAGNFYRWGLATSKDAVTWTKPNLGVERFNGAPATNLLPLGAHPEKGTRSIARDPRPETPPERRYLGVRFTYDGEFVSFSPDGIHWQEHASSPSWFVPSDIIHVMWDERRGRFTAYYKVWELAGTEITAGGTERPFVAHMPTFTDTKLSDDKTAFEGPVIYFKPIGAAEVKKETFVLRAGNQGKDDGGGTSLSGAWTAKRVQAWAESDDGIHWRNEQVVLRADHNDPPTSNIQYMFVMQHGGYYLGFLTMHDEAGHFRIQLAHSADGLRWHRPSRVPWLDIGPDGAFDTGMVLGPADPILWQREMWFPYGGFPIRHDSPRQDWQSAIGLATMRLDGFAAWRAGLQAGELITQPFRCDGDRLLVNADASRGSVAVGVVGAEGFEGDACEPIQSDAVDGIVRWKTREDLKSLRGRTIQLRFVVKDADLFSFRIADETSMTLKTPRATKH